MKVVTFEGTPEEFKAVAHLFVQTTSPVEQPKNGQKTGATVDPQKAIRAMLKRIPIPDGQKAVYKALVGSGELSYSEFARRVGKPPAKLAGVMGALGRRINNTPEIHEAGLKGTVHAIFNYRQESEGWYIALTPDAEQVLKAEKII